MMQDWASDGGRVKGVTAKKKPSEPVPFEEYCKKSRKVKWTILENYKVDLPNGSTVGIGRMKKKRGTDAEFRLVFLGKQPDGTITQASVMLSRQAVMGLVKLLLFTPIVNVPRESA